MPSSFPAPQYWAKKSMPPPTKPQNPENRRLENWAQRPTAPTVFCPIVPSIMVSTMLPVVVRTFCSATGSAMVITMERSCRFEVF